jgi:outer membrane protein assembly factor BamB
MSCKKSTKPIGTEYPPTGYQEDIQWPSLADSPWPMAHHDPQNTGRSKLWGPTKGIISWEFDEAYKMVNSVVVGNDSTVYILIPPANGGLFAFKPNGILKWRLDIPTAPKLYTTPIILADGYIYCYDGNNIVYVVNPNGTIQNTFNLDFPTMTRTFIPDKSGLLYYIDTNSRLTVIDKTGNVQWTMEDNRFYSFSTFLTFSPKGDIIYILSNTDKLLALDISTRQILWSFKEDILPEDPTMSTANGISIDSDGNIYFLTQKDYHIAELFVLRSDGDIKWRYQFNTDAVNDNIPTIDKQGNLYYATDSLYSFDFEGNLRWKLGLDNICDCPLICDDNGSVYVGTMGVSIIGFDNDGYQLWKIDDNQNQVGGSPAIGFDEMMFFPTWSSNKLYGIE